MNMGEEPGEFFIFSMKPSCSTEIGMYVTPTYIVDGALKAS